MSHSGEILEYPSPMTIDMLKTFVAFIFVVELLSRRYVDGACNPPPPLMDCVSHYNPNVLDEETIISIMAVPQSIIEKSHSQTLVAGHKARLGISANVTGLSDLNLAVRPFYKGCSLPDDDDDWDDNIQCSSSSTDSNMILSVNCTIHNVSSLANNDTDFDFLLLSPKYHVFFCTTTVYPSIHLLVEEKPPAVEILNISIDYRFGVSLVFSPLYDADSRIICNVFTDEGHHIYHNKSCNNSTVIPPEVFKNHTGAYTVTTQTVKTVARGEKTNKTFSLGTEAIYAIINDVKLSVIEDNFYLTIVVQVHFDKPLTIPNYINIYSNCLSSSKFEEIEFDQVNQLVYLYRLDDDTERYCSFTIEDSADHKRVFDKNISISFIQGVKLNVLGSYISVVCDVLLHSLADGCQIRVMGIDSHHHNNLTIFNITRNQYDSSSLATDILGPIELGVYNISIKDLINEESHWGKEILYIKIVNVSSSSLPGEISSVSILPSPSQACRTNIVTVTLTLEIPDRESKHTDVAGWVLFLVAVIVGTLIIIGVIIWAKYVLRKNKQIDHVCITGILRRECDDVLYEYSRNALPESSRDSNNYDNDTEEKSSKRPSNPTAEECTSDPNGKKGSELTVSALPETGTDKMNSMIVKPNPPVSAPTKGETAISIAPAEKPKKLNDKDILANQSPEWCSGEGVQQSTGEKSVDEGKYVPPGDGGGQTGCTAPSTDTETAPLLVVKPN